MSNAKAKVIADQMQMAIHLTTEAAAAVPEEKRMYQNDPEKAHPTWLLGHLAVVTSNAINGVALGNIPIAPPEYKPLFAPTIMGGGPVLTDPSAYPAWDEILAVYQKAGAECVAAIRGLDDHEFDGPAKGKVPEPLQEILAVLGGALDFFILHNAHHTGQLAQLAAAPAHANA